MALCEADFRKRGRGFRCGFDDGVFLPAGLLILRACPGMDHTQAEAFFAFSGPAPSLPTGDSLFPPIHLWGIAMKVRGVIKVRRVTKGQGRHRVAAILHYVPGTVFRDHCGDDQILPVAIAIKLSLALPGLESESFSI